MDYRIIKAPTRGTRNMLKRRVDASFNEIVESAEAVGLLQGKVCDLLYASDIAEKASNVEVAEVRGNCPQHFITIGIFGDTESVNTAVSAVKENMGKA